MRTIAITRLARGVRLSGPLVFALLVCGCNNDAKFDPATQIGPNPMLPEPQQYLLPQLSDGKRVKRLRSARD
jgi:hypothetical protein